jgi:hypothetical protein
MSDWKSRAIKVDDTAEAQPAPSNWKSRAEPIHTAAAPAPEESTLTSLSKDAKDLLSGVGQGVTLGFGDELLGGAEALKQKASEALGTSEDSGKNLLELYREYQKQNQDAWDASKARSPWLTTGGEIGGGLLLGGGLGLLGKGAQGASLGMQVLKGAGIGAAAGIGGSKGTIENNPEEMAKDALVSSAFGGVAPVALAGGGKIISKVGQAVEDSPLANKLANTWDLVKNKGYTFSGKKAGAIEDEYNDAIKSITNQFLDPLKQSSKMYGDALDTAASNGSKLSLADDDLLSALKSAQTRYKGGLTPEMQSLLNKHGSQSFDGENVRQLTNALDPSEAKKLQLAIRQLGQGTAYADTTAMSDLDKALTGGIRNSLPEGELSKINSLFGAARDTVAPLVNKGEIDPNFQSKWVSDIDTDTLPTKMNDYLSKIVRKYQDGNVQGDQSRSTVSNILNNLKNVNETNQVNFADPEQIGKQIQDASMKAAIRKGFVGDRQSDSITKVGLNPLDMIASAPFSMTQFAAKGARLASDNPVTNVGRAIFTASDDGLRTVAQKLNESGLGYMGNALSSALDNKSQAAKNAALFTIMQNPNSRKLFTGEEEK